MTLSVPLDVFLRLWPHAPHSLVESCARTSGAVFDRYGLTTLDEVCDFLAQGSEETGGGCVVEECLYYTSERLLEVWPRYFPTIASTLPFAGNPHALANHVYNGHMGNRVGTDDGWNFRGRGFIQLTGRNGFQIVGAAAKLDLVDHPELATDPDHFLEVAAAYWKIDDANKFADRGDFVGETRLINGGLLNLETREAWRAKWRAALGADRAPPTPPAGFAFGSGRWLQDALNRAGASPALDVDGVLGGATKAAVLACQKANGLIADGRAGPQTNAALQAKLKG